MTNQTNQPANPPLPRADAEALNAEMRLGAPNTPNTAPDAFRAIEELYDDGSEEISAGARGTISMRHAFAARQTLAGKPKRKHDGTALDPTDAVFIREGTYYTTVGAAAYLHVAPVTVEHYVYFAQTLEPSVRFPRFLLFAQETLDRFKAEKPRVGVHHAPGSRTPLDVRRPYRKRGNAERGNSKPDAERKPKRRAAPASQSRNAANAAKRPTSVDLLARWPRRAERGKRGAR